LGQILAGLFLGLVALFLFSVCDSQNDEQSPTPSAIPTVTQQGSDTVSGIVDLGFSTPTPTPTPPPDLLISNVEAFRVGDSLRIKGIVRNNTGFAAEHTRIYVDYYEKDEFFPLFTQEYGIGYLPSGGMAHFLFGVEDPIGVGDYSIRSEWDIATSERERLWEVRSVKLIECYDEQVEAAKLGMENTNVFNCEFEVFGVSLSDGISQAMPNIGIYDNGELTSVLHPDHRFNYRPRANPPRISYPFPLVDRTEKVLNFWPVPESDIDWIKPIGYDSERLGEYDPARSTWHLVGTVASPIPNEFVWIVGDNVISEYPVFDVN